MGSGVAHRDERNRTCTGPLMKRVLIGHDRAHPDVKVGHVLALVLDLLAGHPATHGEAIAGVQTGAPAADRLRALSDLQRASGQQCHTLMWFVSLLLEQMSRMYFGAIVSHADVIVLQLEQNRSG